MRRPLKKTFNKGLLMLIPFFAGIFGLYIIPFIISVAYTFTSGIAFRGRFVGFANYKSVFSSSAFQLAMRNTARFLVVSIPLIIVISFLIAHSLFKSFKGSAFFRSVFLYPFVVPMGAIVMFVRVFFEEKGVINSLLATLGFTEGGSWIFSDKAFWVLVMIYIWKNCGYNIVLFLAGFNYVPKEIYEDAHVNGAKGIQVMRYVTIPMMRNSFFFVFVISIVNMFKSFREAYLIGGSLPHESIYMIQHFMTNNFANLNYQRLTIASFSLFLIIFFIVYLLYRNWRKEGSTL